MTQLTYMKRHDAIDTRLLVLCFFATNCATIPDMDCCAVQRHETCIESFKYTLKPGVWLEISIVGGYLSKSAFSLALFILFT